MHTLVNVTFALLWSVALFVGIMLTTERFFPPRRQRAIAATLGAVAFLIGTFASTRDHSGPPGSESLAATLASRNAAGPHDVGAMCHKKSTSSLATNAVGSFDGMRDSANRTTIPNGAAVAASQGATIYGWAVRIDRSGLAAGVCLDVDRTIIENVRVTYGDARKDVAAAYKAPALERSGFEITVPAKTLSPGKHVLRVIVLDDDGAQAALPDDQSITIR